MKGTLVQCWHPDSPGVRVKVWRPWWKRKFKLFASEKEIKNYYKWNRTRYLDVIYNETS